MPIRRGSFAGSVALPPTVTIGSTTNFNQSIATFNAVVNPNGYTTSVQFQYSTNGSTWTNSGLVTNITGNSQSVYYNQTGLSENTLYYVRAIATSPIASVTTSNTSFTTWRLIQYANGTAGVYSFSCPTVTPTGGSPVAPSLYSVFLYGGGGGAGYSGGGGGGYRLRSSYAYSSGINTAITIYVGAGGGATATGGASQIGGTYLSTLNAGGGQGGNYDIGPSTARGGSVGTGDNPAYIGGLNVALYDKNGNLTNWACGGGAGISGNGTDATAFPFVGGNGGLGGTAYGWDGGAGGRGYGTDGYGVAGGYYVWGSGGQAINASGTTGLVTFYYYGA
jgi:hypothetical protein